MAGISIGRFGLNPTLGEIHADSMKLDGDTFTVSGDLIRAAADTDALSVIKLRAVCQQIVGMVAAGAGEIVVPLVWSESTQFDGWWRPISAEHDLAHPVLQGETLRWQFQLERVSGWRAPWLEHRAQLTLLPNDHSLVPVTNFTGPAVGGSAGELSPYPTGGGPTPFAAGDGSTSLWRLEWGSAAETVRRVDYRYAGLAAAHYTGAATIDTYYGTSVPSTNLTGEETEWYPVVGRQVSTPYLRVGNGMVRVRPMDWSTGAGGRAEFEWWSGSAWVSHMFEFGSAGTTSWNTADVSGFGPTLTGVHVLRNSPETSTIRAIYDVYQRGSAQVDFTVRRGGKTVSIVMTEPVGTARQWMIRPVTATPTTSVDAGTMAQTTASSNRKLVFMCPTTHTRNLATGEMFITTANATGRFGVGMQHNTGTAWHESIAAMTAHYYSQPSLKLVAAGR